MDNGEASPYGPEVNQAAGMVSAQANCPIADAFSMMWERADSANVSIEEIATAVLDRSIRFDDEVKG